MEKSLKASQEDFLEGFFDNPLEESQEARKNPSRNIQNIASRIPEEIPAENLLGIPLGMLVGLPLEIVAGIAPKFSPRIH